MDDTEVARQLAAAQLERAQLECQRLTIELARLSTPQSAPWYQKPLQLLPMLTASVSLLAFAFSVVVYTLNQSASAEAAKKAAAREFMKPWIESQWETYTRALSAASKAASSRDTTQQAALGEFWQLYYGPMVVVETKEVSDAMVDLGKCFNEHGECRNLVLGLATQMAGSMQRTAEMNYNEYVRQRYEYIAGPRREQ